MDIIKDGIIESGAVSVTGVVSIDDNGGSITVDGSVGVTGVVSIDDNGGSLTVDGTVAISGTPTVVLDSTSLSALESITVQNGAGASAVNIQDGGNSITVDGTVAASQSGAWSVGLNAGTNNIGDVDVLTVPAPLNVVGGGTEAAALRVTIANDSTGVVSVDDNGSSLTVDGTVAATQSGTWNITNVSGTVSLPTGASTAANQATEITSLQLLDDVVAVDGSAALTKLYQVGGTDGVNAQILSTTSSGHLNIADGGNSLTVDGTVAISGTVPVTDNGGSLTVDGTVAATQSGAWNITDISGTISLPTGAATAANQSTMITSLQLIDNLPQTIGGAVGTTGVMMLGTYLGDAYSLGVNAFGQLIVSVDNNPQVDTELPTASALSDSMSNPTAPAVAAHLMAYNGSTWYRADGADGLGILVDLGSNNDVTVSNIVPVSGNVTHDEVDDGYPVGIAGVAIAHGTNPTAVAAADKTSLYANRHGVLFNIAGHPNIQTVRANYTTAQTNAAIVTVGSGSKIVVTRCTAVTDSATSVDVAVRIGFGTASTPTTTGVVLSHPGIAPGSGIREGVGAGILGIGADDEDLRITSEVPTDGSLDVVVSYYTIES